MTFAKTYLGTEKQRHHFSDKGSYSQSYVFSSSHVWMWELDCKEGWALKNWCSWTVVLEKTFESPLDCKEIQPVHPKRNKSRIFIGRKEDKAEAPILGPHDVKNWLIEKDPDVGKFSSVQLLSRVRVSVTPRIAARQASLSITNSWSLLKLMSIESVMTSSHLILYHPFLLLPPIPPSIRVFSNESTLCMRWPKYWSFSLSISPSRSKSNGEGVAEEEMVG